MAVGSLIQPKTLQFDTTIVGTSDGQNGSTTPHGAVGDKRGPLHPRHFKGCRRLVCIKATVRHRFPMTIRLCDF